MKTQITVIAFLCLVSPTIGVGQLWADTEVAPHEDVVPINVDQFPIAETHHMMKASNAVYQNVVPPQNDGVTPYVLTLKDVPAGKGAFWSVSVYDDRGYFEENDLGRYVVNSRGAVTDDDGSVTIHFGGDAAQPNFLPIMDGWNYMLRIYLPREPYFDGSWKAPEARPAD